MTSQHKVIDSETYQEVEQSTKHFFFFSTYPCYISHYFIFFKHIYTYLKLCTNYATTRVLGYFMFKKT